MFRLIGDIHGKFKNYLSLINESPYPTIQVGDYGLGFYPHVDKGLYEVMKNNIHHRFIRGNHDNLAVCKTFPNYIPDGTVEGNMMFVGGAKSIDRGPERQGIDYWGDEEVSYQEMNSIIDLYEKIKPEIMITHDCPNSVVEPLNFMRHNFTKTNKGSQTRQAFDVMLTIHRPKIWVFGHWHISVDRLIHGTRFICLNELEYVDI